MSDNRTKSQSRVLHRNGTGHYPVAVRGEGCYLIDADGRRYLDASGGAAVACLGHGHAAVVQAVREQVARMAYAHTSFFTNEPMEQLADVLIEDAPPGLSRIYFVSGGSEAVECALKLARQYFVELGQPQRRYFVARRQSYHGNTLGALAVGGNERRRAQFAPLLMQAHHISPCYAYRDMEPGESEEAYGLRVADELETMIVRLGPDQVMAFIAEPVVGATLGAVPAVPGYFRRIRDICHRYGILLILDEVMCGMGRTGTLHACTQEGVAPDLMTIAKGLGGGYQPIGATLIGERIVQAIEGGSGTFQHGHTYVGHATACAAALAVQRTIRQDNLLAAVQKQGQALHRALVQRFGDHPHVGDIRGRGLFWALELVSDRKTKRPFDPDLKLHARVKAEGMAAGLMCYPMGGTVDGREGDHVLLAPPYVISDSELQELIDKLDGAVGAALAGVKTGV